jgi:undecaprenyl-diphosphatase
MARRIARGDPRGRLLAGAVALAVTRAAVRSDHVGPCEARAFEAVNHLPDGLALPVWLVMQGGNLAAAPAAAAVARAAGRPAAARLLLTSGAATWALSKVVKRCAGRPRPDALLGGTRRRGRAQTGSGFVSGHAAVAASLCAAALPDLRPPLRCIAVAAAATVAAARVYVGAHLPLDVIGGTALGLAAEAAIELGMRPDSAGPSAPPRRRRGGVGWPTGGAHT